MTKLMVSTLSLGSADAGAAELLKAQCAQPAKFRGQIIAGVEEGKKTCETGSEGASVPGTYN